MDINNFIDGFTSDQSNPLVSVNNSEFNGNPNDLLFSTDQAAQALSVTGGTTLTSIAPQNVLPDLMHGKLTLPVLLYLVAMGFAFWWLMKKK